MISGTFPSLDRHRLRTRSCLSGVGDVNGWVEVFIRKIVRLFLFCEWNPTRTANLTKRGIPAFHNHRFLLITTAISTSAILTECMKLSVSERIQLVEEIWDSIAAESSETIELSQAQKDELHRRAAACRDFRNRHAAPASPSGVSGAFVDYAHPRYWLATILYYID
jgi:putative addiction module component (TIGR02574 family)